VKILGVYRHTSCASPRGKREEILMPLIDHAKLTGIARGSLLPPAADEEEAGIVADHLIEAI